MKSKWMWVALAALAAVGIYAGTVLATPPSGQSTITLARAEVAPLDIKAKSDPPGVWKAKLKTRGTSDVYVLDNTFQPGGTSGWHTHPGPTLIFVVAGTITNVVSMDGHCMPEEYSAGTSFVEPGGGHVHTLQNHGQVAARTIAVQFLPAGATRRIDANAPC